MNVEYLWADDCPGCLSLKHHNITDQWWNVIETLPDVHPDSRPIGEVTSFLDVSDGEITSKTVVGGNGMHDFAQRRPAEYSGLGTPMMHLVDPYPTSTNPIIGEYSEETGEVYEEIFLTELIGGEMDPLLESWENNSHREMDREPKPWLATRLVMKRIWRFYRHNILDAPEQYELGELAPDLNHGEFQLQGWCNAFSRLYEL